MPTEQAEHLLARLSELGADVVNLNHGRALSTLPAIRYGDYAETARAAMSCAVIVSVDTSILHLAGTLGVPCLGLLQTAPEWRWGLPPNVKTEWYESMTLVRRRDWKDWPGAIAQVVKYLTAMQRSANGN